jgi:Rieske Fe-S protein
MEKDQREDAPNSMNRKQFLILAAAAAACPQIALSAPGGERVVDAGPISNYAIDGMYGSFRDQGFFVIRKGKQLLALSSYCTHRRCKLVAEADRSFYCKCHGSTFDPNGKVTEGPAKLDLATLPASVNEKRHFLVKVPA